MATMTKAGDLRLSAAATLPPEIAGRLLAGADVIARRMTRHIVSGVELGDPRYRSHRYLRTVTAACRDAFRTLVRLLHDGRGLRPGDLDRLGSMGAQQAELGVPLEVVFGAYRVAARVVWQEVIGEPGLLDQVPPATVVAVTGRVLEYLDEISAAAGSAYLATRERLMRQRDRERDRVLQHLLAGDVSPELRRLAASVDLTLAPPYRVLACSVSDTAAERRLDGVWRPAGALLSSVEPGVWMVLASPDLDLDALLPRCDGTTFGIGPVAATLADVTGAGLQARRALDVGRRLEPSRREHRDAEVSVFAALADEPAALQRYVDRILGPVLAQRSPRREELLRTLDAVVAAPGMAEAAAALAVHRHTVLYRVGRLRDLGVDLADPETGHAVWLALRCLRLLGPTPG